MTTSKKLKTAREWKERQLKEKMRLLYDRLVRLEKTVAELKEQIAKDKKDKNDHPS